MRKLLLLAIFLISAYFPPASANSHFQLLKVYAGSFSQDIKLRRLARKNVRNGVIVPDFTIIECTKRVWFGVAFYISPHQANTVSFQRTWYYPHYRDSTGANHHTHSTIYRKTVMQTHGLKKLGWHLDRDEMVDGDITLLLHNDNYVFLRHVFRIRGCKSVNAD